jgi:predicted secreted protein/uncharacterized lipoprotein NlpE involved in copper resistance
MTARCPTAALWFAAALVLVSGCRGSEPQTQTPAEPLFKPVDPAVVANSLNTPGVIRFWGLLPCADCAAIRTELTLVQNPGNGDPQSYDLVETHLGKGVQEEKPFTTHGKWAIERGLGADSTATVYALDGGGKPELARKFERLNDRELRQLDRTGQRIDSELNYVLTRVSDAPAMSLPASGPPTAAPSGPQPAAMVTDMASGWPVTLTPGQELVARLTSDRAAGARWVLRAGSDGGVVAMQGEPISETPGTGPAVEVFRLKATKPGKTTLTFDLKKGSDALKSASYSITVQ